MIKRSSESSEEGSTKASDYQETPRCYLGNIQMDEQARRGLDLVYVTPNDPTQSPVPIPLARQYRLK